MNVTLSRCKVGGTIRVPASKSQTIRALLIAAFARSVSRIFNPLISDDTKSCMEICRKLGADVIETEAYVLVDSTKLGENVEEELDCGNSGTTLFFVTALASTLDIEIKIKGDHSLSNRSAGSLLKSLRDLGVQTSESDYVPFVVHGPIKGGETTIESVSSQYLSGLLLACPFAKTDTRIHVPVLNERPYIEMTESWLDSQGIRYERNENRSYYMIYGNQAFKGFECTISGDWSTACFFLAAAAMTGSTITVEGLSRDDHQADMGVLSILSQMGCSVIWKDNDITLTGPQILTGGTFDLNSMPDALPALAVAGCFADSDVILRNVAHARIKETDRISVMANNLNAIGGDVNDLDDGLLIHPVDELKGGQVSGFGDHRVVMAMAIAALRCKTELSVIDADSVSVTVPHFFALYDRITKFDGN